MVAIVAKHSDLLAEINSKYPKQQDQQKERDFLIAVLHLLVETNVAVKKSDLPDQQEPDYCSEADCGKTASAENAALVRALKTCLESTDPNKFSILTEAVTQYYAERSKHIEYQSDKRFMGTVIGLLLMTGLAIGLGMINGKVATAIAIVSTLTFFIAVGVIIAMRVKELELLKSKFTAVQSLPYPRNAVNCPHPQVS